MNKNIIIIGLLTILSGCVSTKNIPMQENAIHLDKTHLVVISHREIPDFAAQTADKAMFGIFGALAMISKGNEIVQENKIEDPSSHISSEILKLLGNKYQVELMEGDVPLVHDESVEALAGLYSDSDFIMDVKTVNWSFGYFSTDWTTYRVLYSARLRIIDTAKKVAVAEGFCSRIPDKEKDPPTYDQLMENNAERLKVELKAASDYCIEYFKTNTLRL